MTNALTFALSAGTVAALVGTGMLRIDLDQVIQSLWTLPAQAGEGRLTLDFIGPRLKDLLKPGLLARLLALAYCGPVLARPGEARQWASYVPPSG